jgi:hypothetical protein
MEHRSKSRRGIKASFSGLLPTSLRYVVEPDSIHPHTRRIRHQVVPFFFLCVRFSEQREDTVAMWQQQQQQQQIFAHAPFDLWPGFKITKRASERRLLLSKFLFLFFLLNACICIFIYIYIRCPPLRRERARTPTQAGRYCRNNKLNTWLINQRVHGSVCVQFVGFVCLSCLFILFSHQTRTLVMGWICSFIDKRLSMDYGRCRAFGTPWRKEFFALFATSSSYLSKGLGHRSAISRPTKKN